MSRGAAVLAMLLAACGGPGAATSAGGVGNLPSAGAAEAEAAAAANDDAFRALATAVAEGSGRQVVAWGTAPLAEDTAARRWAVLDDPAQERGAYVVEAAPGRTWLVSFYVDGRTQVWARDEPPAGPVPWTARPDREIGHAQGHHHGYARLRLALRGDEPAVLGYESLDDATVDDAPRVEVFDRDGSGVCAPRCPPLAGFRPDEVDLEVRGPSADAAALLRSPDRR